MAQQTEQMSHARKVQIAKQNTRIKAELNEQAHGARMSEFEALLRAFKECLSNEIAEEVLYKGDAIRTTGVLRTEAEARLRGYVNTMSRRIKLR